MKISGYKINIQKWLAVLYPSDEIVGQEINKVIKFTIGKQKQKESLTNKQHQQ